MRGSFRQTFGDNVRNRRYMAEDEVDEDDEEEAQRMTEKVEGEEEESKEKVGKHKCLFSVAMCMCARVPVCV